MCFTDYDADKFPTTSRQYFAGIKTPEEFLLVTLCNLIRIQRASYAHFSLTENNFLLTKKLPLKVFSLPINTFDNEKYFSLVINGYSSTHKKDFCNVFSLSKKKSFIIIIPFVTISYTFQNYWV